MENNIKVIRQSKGLSQQALADLAGLSRLTIIYAEKGINKPTIETGTKIAKALHVSFEDLFFNQNVYPRVQGLKNDEEVSK